MPRGLLWLGLTLLGALQTQARDSTPNLIPAPPLSRVPLQPNFQDDQFQGKWYVVGLAGNAISKEDKEFKMYTTNYELKEDRSYNVTSTLLRNQRCDYFVRTFVQTSKPGQFSLGNIKAYPQLQSYTVRVAATDYNQFRLVASAAPEPAMSGPNMGMPVRPLLFRVPFVKSLGLTDDNIVFPVPIDKCIDDQ
ncbi:PREDICTED: neutrophil gelatinase-associated lipocalin [Myotis brandtii]|uniref:neutrophil gelatinase-associated lipocalin n=1 Tax=Myotis brandtii TaxID=109478 RepID=UPI00070441B2|nr:PREDICTED: neutrophil gelatinase-associated lipocalin [Myotis brandtii]